MEPTSYAAALALRDERDGLDRRIVSLQAQSTARKRAVQNAINAEQAAGAEVEHLESKGLGRAIAVLRRDLDDELDVVRGRHDQATAALAGARAALAQTHRDLGSAEAARRALGDVDAVLAEAEARRADELHHVGGTRAEEVSVNGLDLAAATNRLREVAEAHEAGRRAQLYLEEAWNRLAHADDWSTVDTWLGGGAVSSWVKHQRMDEASAALSSAANALTSFSAELKDVGLDVVGTLRMTPGQRTMDIWFDNIFTDLAVRSQILEARAELDAVRAEVTGLMGKLADEADDLNGRMQSLTAERERLLST